MVVFKPGNLDLLAGTIANRRRALGMTHNELAEKSGISQSMISKIESGSRVPHLMTFVTILSALDLVLKVELENIEK